jgi:hypothetical protein
VQQARVEGVGLLEGSDAWPGGKMQGVKHRKLGSRNVSYKAVLNIVQTIVWGRIYAIKLITGPPRNMAASGGRGPKGRPVVSKRQIPTERHSYWGLFFSPNPQ